MALDAAQGVDCYGSSEKVVRSVAWATTTVCPLASGFSSSTVSDSQTVSAAAEEVFATTHTESSSSKSAGAKFSRNCYRSSTRQSHSARNRDQCPRQCREAALTSLQEALQKAKQSAHVPPIGERLDACTQFLEHARKRLAKADAELLNLQTERAQLATELAEGQARFEALRAEAGAKPPSHPAAPKDLGSELERMQRVIDDLLRERSQWTGGRHGGPAGVTKSLFPWIWRRLWALVRHVWKL